MESLVLVGVAWVVVGLLSLGLGSIPAFGHGELVKDSEALFERFWLGWSFLILVLPLWHLWFPVDGRFWIPVCVLSAYGWVRAARFLRAAEFRRLRPGSVTLVILLLTVLWALRQGLTPVERTADAGLYHLATIRWANAFPAVPGLGNLHGRLAFNSADLLYIASVNIGPLAGKGWYVANSLLSAVLGLQLVGSAVRVYRSRAKTAPQPVDLFRLLIALPFLMVNCADTSTANDLAVAVLQIVVMSSMLQVLTTMQRREAVSAARVWRLAIYCAAGIAIKLSFAALGIAALAIVLLLIAIRQAWGQQTFSRLGAISGTVIIVLLPWVAHGITLSGYPFYPSTVAPMPVAWRVPAAQATADRTDITAYARLPGPAYRSSLDNWHWLKPWLQRIGRVLAPPVLLTLIFVVPFWYRSKPRAESLRTLLTPALAPPLLASVVWFLEAPEPRFAGVLLWIIPACLVLISSQERPWREWSRALWLFLIIAAGSTVLNHSVEDSLRDIAGHPWRSFTPAPSVPLRVFTTNSGLRVFVPVSGDKGWNAPLPETPYPNPRLRLRCSTGLACGFTQ